MKKIKSCLDCLYNLAKPFRKGVWLTVILGICRIVLSLLFVWVCKTLVDIATNESDSSLTYFVIIMISITISRVLIGTGASYVENFNSLKATNSIRYRLFSHVIQSEWNGKETFHSGDTINRLEEDVRVVVDVIVTKVPHVAVTIFQLILASLYLVTLSPGLMWALLALMVFGVVASKMFFNKLRELTTFIRQCESRIQEHMQENLQNRALVLTLIGVQSVLKKLENLQKDEYNTTVKRLNYNAIARMSLHLGFTLGYASAFLWGIFGIRDGVVTYGMMTAFLQLVNQVQMPIVEMSRHIPSFIHSLSSVERIMELEELKLEDDGGKDIFFDGPVDISVNNISFSYPKDERKVFDDFSFDFRAGQMTVVSGPTGTGKSTLIKILLSLLKPSRGEILFNGQKLSSGMRCNMMYVPQGNSLFSGSIRDNLKLSNPSATEEQIKDALRASVADFVFSLKDGLDTICSEDGGGLSEGQAQRIAIARALLHPGSILVLDESTSALDADTEYTLLKNLYDNYHGVKTIIFISHREAVFQYADSRLILG